MIERQGAHHAGSSQESPVTLSDVAREASDMSVNLMEAATRFSKAADDFSKKPPGNQLSYCGYFLVFVPIAIKVFGLVKGQLEFSDNIAIGMLILGVACLVAGGGFNTFFAHKLATSLEVEARILRQEATETARERRGLLLRLMGRE